MRLIFPVALLGVGVTAREASFVLKPDHETYEWRKAAGHPRPDMHKVVVWTRHEQVGIGNAFGGYGRVMQDALLEDRTLVIYSLIFQKFCEILACAMEQIPGDGYEKARGDDATRASHFQISMSSSRGSPAEDADINKFYSAAGCGTYPSGHEDDREWPHRCFYSTLVRGFIDGPGARLRANEDWLRPFYVGSDERFRHVLRVDKSSDYAFDVSIHVRTLELIEDMSTEVGDTTTPNRPGARRPHHLSSSSPLVPHHTKAINNGCLTSCCAAAGWGAN